MFCKFCNSLQSADSLGPSENDLKYSAEKFQFPGDFNRTTLCSGPSNLTLIDRVFFTNYYVPSVESPLKEVPLYCVLSVESPLRDVSLYCVLRMESPLRKLCPEYG